MSIPARSSSLGPMYLAGLFLRLLEVDHLAWKFTSVACKLPKPIKPKLCGAPSKFELSDKAQTRSRTDPPRSRAVQANDAAFPRSAIRTC